MEKLRERTNLIWVQLKHLFFYVGLCTKLQKLFSQHFAEWCCRTKKCCPLRPLPTPFFFLNHNIHTDHTLLNLELRAAILTHFFFFGGYFFIYGWHPCLLLLRPKRAAAINRKKRKSLPGQFSPPHHRYVGLFYCLFQIHSSVHYLVVAHRRPTFVWHSQVSGKIHAPWFTASLRLQCWTLPGLLRTHSPPMCLG